jgi:hypothetical protein
MKQRERMNRWERRNHRCNLLQIIDRQAREIAALAQQLDDLAEEMTTDQLEHEDDIADAYVGHEELEADNDKMKETIKDLKVLLLKYLKVSEMN